jgi:hypothetical protein
VSVLDIANVWSTAAGVAFVLTLAAGVGAAFAVGSIWRLRQAVRVIEAAENFQAVDLTTVVKRYVPAEHQTHLAHDEMAVAKVVIAARRPRMKRLAAVFALVLVCGAATATYSVHRYLQTTAAVSATAQPRPNFDSLKVIQGVWGWRADFLLSCSENPQTIQVVSSPPGRSPFQTSPAFRLSTGQERATKQYSQVFRFPLHQNRPLSPC